MPDLPFFEGHPTYHRYRTASGDIILMPSAGRFFMALHPESRLNEASYALGNGLGVLETMLAGVWFSGSLMSG